MMMSDVSAHPIDIHLFTDASSSCSFGCGACWSTKWLQYPWPNEAIGLSIAVKELVPILMAGVLWGDTWRTNMCLSTAITRQW